MRDAAENTMPSRRVLKVAEAIREVVSMAILVDLNDPRVQDVTVTYVEVSGDLRLAKVHVSVMGDEVKQELSLRGLESAAGFLQSKCARGIDTRYTPRIEFILDQGVKRSIEISRLLEEVLPDCGRPGGGNITDAEAEPDETGGGNITDAEAEPDETGGRSAGTQDESEPQP